MAEKLIDFYIGDFSESEALKLDGSNLIAWYKRVYKMMKDNDAFDIMFKPLLEEEPDDPDSLEYYLDGNAISMNTKKLLYDCMVPELRNQFDDLAYSNSLIHELILKFDDEWRIGQLKYFNKFLLKMMEESTDVEIHLGLMEEPYDFLTEGLD